MKKLLIASVISLTGCAAQHTPDPDQYVQHYYFRMQDTERSYMPDQIPRHQRISIYNNRGQAVGTVSPR